MSIALATLADRLQRTVPERNDVPSDYEQLCRDAVAQLSQDVPVITSVTIQVTAGQATYALPADFLSVIELAGMAASGRVILGDNGIVPLSGDWQEAHYVEGDTLRLDPVPAYSAARTLRYAARHVAVNGVYGRLSENGARVALLYGQYMALMEQANAQAGDGWSYKIGDESVDKRGVSAGIQAQAAQALTGYHNAMRPLQGYGSRYKANPYSVGAVEV
jgi:hypothetical protein